MGHVPELQRLHGPCDVTELQRATWAMCQSCSGLHGPYDVTELQRLHGPCARAAAAAWTMCRSCSGCMDHVPELQRLHRPCAGVDCVRIQSVRM